VTRELVPVQVLNKQVITRTSGRCLGSISGAWLDPAAGTLVSFDLDERRQGGSGGLGSLSTPPRAGNIPLSALRQVRLSLPLLGLMHTGNTAPLLG
jgi:hypothetical protein